MRFAAGLALPVVHNLERPIHAMDIFACKALDKMEAALPGMKDTPEEVKSTNLT